MTPTKKPINYEGRHTIYLTTRSMAGRIAEAREQLDAWLATLAKPPHGMVQALRLVSSGRSSLTYEITLRARIQDEPITILG